MAGEQPWCVTLTATLSCWSKESWIDDWGRCCNPCRPQNATCLDPLATDHHAVGVTRSDRLPHPHLHAEPFERTFRGSRRSLGESRKQPRPSLDEDDSRLGGIDAAKIMDQRRLRKLRDGAGKLDAGRTGTDQHEIEQPTAFARIVRDFGGLEGGVDLLANG